MCNLTDELGKAHMGPLSESGRILQVGPLSISNEMLPMVSLGPSAFAAAALC